MSGAAAQTGHARATAAPRRRLTRAMQLREVLGDAARDAPPVEVTALAYDNRLVTPGTLFFCVPGSNGKTTTAFLTRGLLEAAGRRTGLLGTVTAVVGGEERPMVRPTPEAIDLQRTFAEMREAGDEAVVMEGSSHALE